MEWFKFEKAMRLLVSHFPIETKKPALFHSVRVGTYLWNHNYSEDIQIAWLLHDALEDTDMTETQIKEWFGEEVLAIVKANSENLAIEKSLQREDIVKRCSEVWENALIVKMADVYDNYKFYIKQQDPLELAKCKYPVTIERIQNFSKLIMKYKNANWNDPIFERAQEIINHK